MSSSSEQDRGVFEGWNRPDRFPDLDDGTAHAQAVRWPRGLSLVLDISRYNAHEQRTFYGAHMPKVANIPPYDAFMNLLLQALKSLGGSGTIEEINAKVIEAVGLSDEQLELIHDSMIVLRRYDREIRIGSGKRGCGRRRAYNGRARPHRRRIRLGWHFS